MKYILKYILKSLFKKWNSSSNKKWTFFLGVVMAYIYQHLKQEQTVLDPRKTFETFHERPLKPFLLCNSGKWNPSSAHCNLKIFGASILKSVTMHSICVVMQLLIVNNFWLTTQKHLLSLGPLIRKQVWGITALTLQETTKDASDLVSFQYS